METDRQHGGRGEGRGRAPWGKRRSGKKGFAPAKKFALASGGVGAGMPGKGQRSPEWLSGIGR